MEVLQLEEREFYGRIICNKGRGIAALLYKALESLASFKVQSSNLAAPDVDNYVLTFNLRVSFLYKFATFYLFIFFDQAMF